MIINDASGFIVSRTAKECRNPHFSRAGHTVTSRTTKEVIGFLVQSASQPGTYGYALADDKYLTQSSGNRALALDKLISAFSPSAAWLN